MKDSTVIHTTTDFDINYKPVTVLTKNSPLTGISNLLELRNFLFIKKGLLVFLVAVLSLSGKAQTPTDQINWPKFLSNYDLTFKKMPANWRSAPYFGNGFIGSMIYADSIHNNRLILQVFRTDVQDHRTDSAGWTAYSRPRLPIGYFTLDFKGAITSCNLRLSLWDASLKGIITTDKGSFVIQHFVDATKDLIYTKLCKSGGEDYILNWHPAEAISTRKVLFPNSVGIIAAYAKAYGNKYLSRLQVYQANPSIEIKKVGLVNLSVQNLLSGGQYATAWAMQPGGFVITIKNSYPQLSAESRALQNIENATPATVEYAGHLKWWHAFYTKSFMSIPDKNLEGLYWLQLYKLGSATRADGPIMDTSGPWFETTPWPYLTWDLNVQLCYWALNASNHVDIGMSLPHSLNKYKSNLVHNVQPVAWQKDAAYMPLATEQDLIGNADDDVRYQNLHANLPWIMHNVWLMYRYTMNKEFLKIECYPLLKRSINYYLHKIEKRDDGKYHIPVGYSPEYPGKSIGAAGETGDPNIDIALIKWGLQTLIASSTLLMIDINEQPHWKEVLQNLVNYPVDEKGFKIGADQSFDQSHRHYSHLLMIYPLYLVNKDQPGSLPLIRKSLDTWAGNTKALRGYSYTGAASIAAAIGEGDTALNYLKGLSPFLLPNGLYTESGPCFETPLSAAQSLQDMLLQSWGNQIRLFPAVPSIWKDLTIYNWLAEGAFEVSAETKNGSVDFITIKSLAGSPCILNAILTNPVAHIQGKKVVLKSISQNCYSINVKKGETVIIRNAHFKGNLSIDATN
jgi:alpha-L-fucosidase 2